MSAYAKATVSLPSKAVGLSPLPQVPHDIAAKAAQMYARHCELSEARRRAG